MGLARWKRYREEGGVIPYRGVKGPEYNQLDINSAEYGHLHLVLHSNVHALDDVDLTTGGPVRTDKPTG